MLAYLSLVNMFYDLRFRSLFLYSQNTFSFRTEVLQTLRSQAIIILSFWKVLGPY